ncbi:hypothetical protein N5B55_21455 [Ralstonia pickettii]|uniref:hypothetical protein n=1 Tax=Ralstonia pickettii TaxID=329 RepID=UPI0027149243|nr:hypothetical protein [Ralstonia pickettii]WKZ87324.1 hypothetical protein N5B55_21455 [Ralstonia pickettii]
MPSSSTWEAKWFKIRNVEPEAETSAHMTNPELREEHYAYVCDIADRLGLPPTTVEPVFRETLRTLSAGATIETFVVLLAAKRTLVKLKKMSGQR